MRPGFGPSVDGWDINTSSSCLSRLGSAFELSIRRGVRTLWFFHACLQHVSGEAQCGAAGWEVKHQGPGWAQPASRASHMVLAVYFNHHPKLPAAVFFTAASVPFCRAHCRAPLELVLGSRTKQKSIGLCADVEVRCIHSAQSLP